MHRRRDGNRRRAHAMQLASTMRTSLQNRRGDDSVGSQEPARFGTPGHERTLRAVAHVGRPVPIVALANDWNGEYTSPHHVLRELAKTRRVVWLDLAAPDPGVKGLRKKLADMVRGPVRVEHDLWVATPIALPTPERPMTKVLDRWLVEGFVRAVRSRLGIARFQLWSFLPNVSVYLGMGEELSVYYCGDDCEDAELLSQVDAVFAANHDLAVVKRERNPSTFVAPHGVDHALFATALDPDVRVPAELAALPHPRIGFAGDLRNVDVELIAELARMRPAWSIVLTGQPSSALDLPNVHLLGARDHDELPAFYAGIDVGMLPYRGHVNPLQLRECLAAGRAVVSTPMPETERYPGLCHIASDAQGFVAAIEQILATDSRAARLARSAAMSDETWTSRVECMTRRLDDVGERVEPMLIDPLA